MIRRASPGHPAPHPVRLDRRTVILRRGAVVRILGGGPVTLGTPAPEAASMLKTVMSAHASAVVAMMAPKVSALLRRPVVFMEVKNPGPASRPIV